MIQHTRQRIGRKDRESLDPQVSVSRRKRIPSRGRPPNTPKEPRTK